VKEPIAGDRLQRRCAAGFAFPHGSLRANRHPSTPFG
jgi:hypothetical protein